MSEVTLQRKMSVFTLKTEPHRIGSESFPYAIFRGADGFLDLQMRQETWVEMGSPKELTVALWPGDRQDLMESEEFPS